jgi:hypothetical protein
MIFVNYTDEILDKELPQEYKATNEYAAEADFNEVNRRAIEYENQMRYKKSNNHVYYPWWNKSVSEQIKDCHVKKRYLWKRIIIKFCILYC